VNSLKSSVSWGSVSTRTFHDDWKQTSLRPQAESAKVASSSDENRTGDNSSNLATVINGPGTEDFHYTRSSASRAILSNNFLSGQAFTNVNDIANTPELVIKPGVLCTVLGSRYYFALIHAILLQCIWFCVQGWVWIRHSEIIWTILNEVFLASSPDMFDGTAVNVICMYVNI